MNPLFTSPTAFHPATDTAGAELKLFAQAGIHLVHGWLVHPGSDEAYALEREGIKDYDSAVAFIAEADFLGGGIVVGGESGTGLNGNGGREWTEEERRKIKNGMCFMPPLIIEVSQISRCSALTIRHFLESSQSQLTYHGLFHLASELPSGSLVALFRSSHLAVLLKGGQEKARPQGTTRDGRGEVAIASSNKLESGVTAEYYEAPTTSIQPMSSLRQPDTPHASSTLAPTPDPHYDTVANSSPQPQGNPSPDQGSSATSPGPSHISSPQDVSPSTHDPPQVGAPLVEDFSALSLELQAPGPSLSQHAHAQEPSITTRALQAPSSPPPLTLSPPGPHIPSPITKAPEDTALYTLVTDQVFLQEPSVVWERIEDVDGAAGGFVDGRFLRFVMPYITITYLLTHDNRIDQAPWVAIGQAGRQRKQRRHSKTLRTLLPGPHEV